MSTRTEQRNFRRWLLLLSLTGVGIAALGEFLATVERPHFEQALAAEVSVPSHFDNRRSPELLIMLGFSGGGTRAAALSYGVLQELAATRIRVGSA